LLPHFLARRTFAILALNNAPVLIVSIGMTMVILVKQIDISVGSQFAVAGVCAGLLAKSGIPMPFVLALIVLIGAVMGAINGALIGMLRLPSIIVTLAMLVAWRDGLRWTTGGEWVQNLPPNFQWFGMGQNLGQGLILISALVVLVLFAWTLRNLAAGRAVYAVGSDAEAARLAGIEPTRVTFSVFVIVGALVGLAALLNAVRFSIVPSNAGVGLELKAIAAVVVGGTAITGGRGTLIGTLIGVALLGTIGTALTFVGINPFWEKAIQGAIILAALASDFVLGRVERMRAAQV
jgi:rhamnose transport system permease protein